MIAGASFRGPAGSITRSVDGTIFLVDNSDDRVKSYDRSGRFLREIGRKGAGPGEYEEVIDISAGVDSRLHLFDAALARWSEFEYSGKFVTSSPIPAYFRANGVLMRGPRGLIINGIQTPSTGPSSALTMVDRNGQTRRTLDTASENIRASWLFERRLTAMPGGGFLSVRPYTFTFDLYDAEGRRTRSWRRVAEWVPVRPPAVVPSDGLFDRRPDPFVMAVWSDSAGLVWVAALVPSIRWQSVPHPGRGRMPRVDSLRALGARPRVETIIEVVDLKRAMVVARTRFDRPIGVFFADGLVANGEEDAAGEPMVRVSRLRLQQK
jgi:hypothetical protein